MSKNRMSAILMGFILFLVIAIAILIITLSLRPENTTTEVLIGNKQDVWIQEEGIPEEEVDEQEKEVVAEPVISVKWVRSIGKVNVRSQDNSESVKLGTLSDGEELVMLDVLESGWTKVEYDGAEGYVKSEYLEFIVSTEEELKE